MTTQDPVTGVIGIEIECTANSAGLDNDRLLRLSFGFDSYHIFPQPPPQAGLGGGVHSDPSGKDPLIYVDIPLFSGDTAKEAAGRIAEQVAYAEDSGHLPPDKIDVEWDGTESTPADGRGGGNNALCRVVCRGVTHSDYDATQKKIDIKPILIDPSKQLIEPTGGGEGGGRRGKMPKQGPLWFEMKIVPPGWDRRGDPKRAKPRHRFSNDRLLDFDWWKRMTGDDDWPLGGGFEWRNPSPPQKSEKRFRDWPPEKKNLKDEYGKYLDPARRWQRPPRPPHPLLPRYENRPEPTRPIPPRPPWPPRAAIFDDGWPWDDENHHDVIVVVGNAAGEVFKWSAEACQGVSAAYEALVCMLRSSGLRAWHDGRSLSFGISDSSRIPLVWASVGGPSFDGWNIALEARRPRMMLRPSPSRPFVPSSVEGSFFGPLSTHELPVGGAEMPQLHRRPGQ